MTHFLDVTDHDAGWVRHVLAVARRLREQRGAQGPHAELLRGRTLAMLFEKPSLRTRVSFEQAMYELGGRAIVLQQQEVGLGSREGPADVVRVLNGMVHAVAARVFEHAKLEEMARHAKIPVINALSDTSHPCQALADVLTIRDAFGPDLEGRTVAFIGDGNNVARSLSQACAALGMRFILASPPGYGLAEEEERGADGRIAVVHDPAEAVAGADVLYTDTFVSMGQEGQKQRRLARFEPYQLNEALLAKAPSHAIVLHCLPAYRGVEISEAVLEGPASRVFEQAHNRLHAQKGLLAVVMGGL